MSETIQFMAGAGQTGTSGLLPSSRSDAQDGQGLAAQPFTDPENKRTGRSNQATINEAPHTEQFRVQQGVTNCRAAPQIGSPYACGIRTQSNPKALDALTGKISSAYGSDSARGFEASLEQLSKASPCLLEKTAFELTRKWGDRRICSLGGAGEGSRTGEAREDVSFRIESGAMATHDGLIAAGAAATMFDVCPDDDSSSLLLSPAGPKTPSSEQDGEPPAEPGTGFRRRATARLRSLQVGEEENQIDIASNQAVSFYCSSTAQEPAFVEPGLEKGDALSQNARSRNSQAVPKPLSRSQADSKWRSGARK